jgi:hypothetical protein
MVMAMLGFCIVPAMAGEGGKQMFLTEKDIMGVVGQMHAKFGVKEKQRYETTLPQMARLWTEKDGTAEDFAKFCSEHFMTGKDLDGLFERCEYKLEQINGHMLALFTQLRLETDETRGKLLPVDHLFSVWNPSAHVTDDLFQNKLAFVVLLNFPIYTLEDLIEQGGKWSRRKWAEVRLAQRFAYRVPAEVSQQNLRADAEAEAYIADYNIVMDRVVDRDGKSLFRKGLKLISHWGLRDEIKAQYVDKQNLEKQEVIHTIMERIIRQEIPQVVIDNPKVSWDPVANTVDGKKAEREQDVRFQHLLDVFRARKLKDPYYPRMPTHIDRRFKIHREIPEKEFVGLLESVLKAPVSKPLGLLIEKRLGRKLRPFDIWYDFKAGGRFNEEDLDKVVKRRYPNLESFQQDIPVILAGLGFDRQTAAFLSDRIEIDPARGSGHALGPQMRTEKAHLRTRVPADGMNYKGFNIAMHELGHNVEQIFSLYRVDHTLLEGVPNNAFTEGFAFVFQARDLDVLGLSKPDPQTESLKALHTFWATREMAGVGIVDIKVWHWMYDHPKATPVELRDAVIQIAGDVWNEHYADIFGIKDSPLLAIYSHMINAALYLPDYTLGHLIAFQVENYFKTHELAREMERMCKLGNISPNLWMQQAVGKPISAKPMIQAAQKALKFVKSANQGAISGLRLETGT